MLPLTQKSMKINEHHTFACAWLDCECPAEIWPTDNSQERPWSFRSLEALQEMNSTRHHQQCLQALTIAVVWYSLYCNSMFTDLRHRPRPDTKLEIHVRLMVRSSACPPRPCRRSQMATFSLTGLQFLRSSAEITMASPTGSNGMVG